MGTSVIVVGAGPVGLMLAGELRLGGVDVVVYEQRTAPAGESRGIGCTSRAGEVFDQRGLLTRLAPIEPGQQTHFGGVQLDTTMLEDTHHGFRGAPQYRIESVLEEWALGLGASIRRGHTVVDLRQDADGVAVVVTGPGGQAEDTAEYLVGCDGARSTVRQLAGIDFPGSSATRGMYLADVVGCDVRPRYIGERVPGAMVMSARLEDGADRVTIHEDVAPPPEGHTMTFAEFADTWERLTGESIHSGQARWISSFTDAARHAAEYRRGRVFLAGDAAHIHLPAGAQGLSVGVQDAVNLGWKLAATIRGWAPEGLLDTYHTERHPVGGKVVRNTRAQAILYLNGDEVEPLRAVMRELVTIPDAARHLAGSVSGLDVRYEVGASGHPLLGVRMPNHEMRLPDGSRRRVMDLLRRARGVLVSTDGSAGAAEVRQLAAGWADRVDFVAASWTPDGAASRQLPPPDSVLIRPDGYVAWVSPDGGDLRQALERWFGAARPVAGAAGSAPANSPRLVGSAQP
jgi:2-polyprenyl-6-methoxyphenol hydroxylase-like FAD-dependent oxidoreductase